MTRNLKTHPDIFRLLESRPLQLRIWHVPNPPREGLFVEVKSVEEALVVLNALAQYDRYLDTVFHKDAVFMNAQGLEWFNPISEDWEEWVNENDSNIDHF
jgi:hypothetical protein